MLEFAGIKLRAILLARRWKEGDLVDDEALARAGISPGFFLKFTNRLVHGKERAAPNDVKLKCVAKRLGISHRLLTQDALWPENGTHYGLSETEARAMAWLRSLYAWYINHVGPEAAHKYLSQDFDALHRQTEVLQALARGFGSEALSRVFVLADYEYGHFDREFASIERLISRCSGMRQKILAYVRDVPAQERCAGRVFLPLEIGDLTMEIVFGEDLPRDRSDVRYAVRAGRDGVRRLLVRTGLSDERLMFVLAREAAVYLAGRHGLIDPALYAEHHWPCAIERYAQQKADVIINRGAAALLLPRPSVRARERDILVNFSHETVEAASRDFGCAPETLLLRIVQLNPRQAHFIRVDAPGPSGPYTLERLFRGNGLPIGHRVRTSTILPTSWGVMKSATKFFAADPRKASAVSRHVQLTQFARCGNTTYICMSLTYPRYGGGAKALCIGFRAREFKEMFGRLPVLTEKKVGIDDDAYDVDWSALGQMERESRERKAKKCKPRDGEMGR